MIRHKRVVSTLDVGSSADWNDDHQLDPTDEIENNIDMSFTTFGAHFDNTQCANGGTAAFANTLNHVFMTCTSSAGAGGLACVRGINGDFTDLNDLPILTMAVDLPTVQAQEFGFFVTATAPFTANQSGAYFRVAGGILYSVTGNGAAETTVNLGAPSQYGVYRIEFTSTQVKFYVDDLVTPAATHILTIPTDALNFKAASAVSGGVSQIARMDFVGLTRLRAQ